MELRLAATVLTLRCLLACSIVAGIAGCHPSPPLTAAEASVRDQLEPAAARLGIEIEFAVQPGEFANRYGTITWKPPDEYDLPAYTKVFLAEFEMYSRSFLQDIGLRRVYLCRALRFAGQARLALPEFGTDTLYLDTLAIESGRLYARKVIHHELFHLLDYADDGDLFEDASWCKINPTDWHYGTGGKGAQDKPESSILTDAYPGFLNYYSTTGVEEDKAEIYANAIVEPVAVGEFAAKDAVIAKKLDRMGMILDQASPSAGAALWKLIHASIPAEK